MKATDRYLPLLLFIMLYMVVLTFPNFGVCGWNPVECPLNKSYWVVLTCGAVFYAAHARSNFSSLWTIILKCDHSESCLAVLWIQNGKEYWFLISLSFSLRRALAMFNYEERSKRENKILSDFREMIHQKINNKKWTVNHNNIFHSYTFCHLPSCILNLLSLLLLLLLLSLLLLLLLLLLSLSLLSVVLLLLLFYFILFYFILTMTANS